MSFLVNELDKMNVNGVTKENNIGTLVE